MQNPYAKKRPTRSNGREPSEIVKYMKELTPEQEKVVTMFVEEGKNKHQIAKELGTAPQAVSRALNQEHVNHEVARRREDYRIRMKLSREDVAQVFSDAIEMARVMAEPSTMIQGAREVGKMLGYYEPEVVKVQLSEGSKSIQDQLKTLTDAELYQLLEKEVDGERLPDDQA